MRFRVRDPRLLLLIGAVGLLAAALVGPQWPMTRDGFDVLAVVDITGSMNVRDYAEGGRPISRLEAVKSALRAMIAEMPCPSRVALGVFTERRPFLLFEPIDACADYAPLEASIAALDWRMAWEGDSRISAGLFRAIDMAREMKTDLLFFTDGQEAPPLPASGGPSFDAQRSAVHGLVVGVGGYELSPIPKFDDKGREIGFFSADDVPHESRFGLPPKGAEQRDGYNARNAPFGGEIAVGVEHMSSVREPYLQSLADKTGLTYTHLVDAPGLLKAFAVAGAPRPRRAQLDLPPFLGAAAGASLFALYVAPLLFEMLSARKNARGLAANPQPRRRK